MACLTDSQIRTTQPREKIYKLADGGSLSVWILPSGAKSFRFKYRFKRRNDSGELVTKEDSYTIGRYPKVSLKQARRERDRLRAMLDNGLDPKEEKRRKQREIERRALALTFADLTGGWLEQHNWTTRHYLRVQRSLEIHAFPVLARLRAEDITYQDVNQIINTLKGDGKPDMARRVLNRIRDILDYGIAQGVLSDNVAKNKQLGRFIKSETKHFGAIKFFEVPNLLTRLHDYEVGIGTLPQTGLLIRLSLLTAVRPSEARLAQKDEFNLEGKQWEIPGKRMKSGDPHIIPLARQTLSLLGEIKGLKLPSALLLPGRETNKSLSENTVNKALRSMGFLEATGHGMRTLFSTEMNERGYNRDHIEMQLAHKERSRVRASYNRAEYLESRRELMQAWADLVIPDG